MHSTTLSEIQSVMPHFTLLGDPAHDMAIRNVTLFSEADHQSLVFVTQPKFLTKALNCDAGALLTSEKIWKATQTQVPSNKVILLHPNPDFAIATIIRKFFARDIRKAAWWNGVHPSAVLGPDVHLGQNVLIGPGASIAPGCHIGDDVYIGPGVTIEENVRVGANTIIHAHVFIGHHCELGKNCEIQPNTTLGSEGFGYSHNAQGEHYRIPHQGRLLIGDRVDIGANCGIDRGTLDNSTIGDGTKIDNLCHTAHNFKIGKNCLITAHFVAAGSVNIGDNVITGGRVSVTGHISITSNVHIGGHGAVTSDITKPGAYGGHPLQPLQDYLKSTVSIAQLPRMRKQLSLLMKTVFPESDTDKARSPEAKN